MLKRISLLAAAAALALVGCQPPVEPADTSVTLRSDPVNGEKFTVGVSIPAADHGWTAGVKYWADEATKLHPDMEWIIEDANEAGEQISDLENMQSQGVDAVVILAVESAALTPMAKKLKEEGVMIINVDRGFTEPVADVFIEGDNKAFGRTAAEYIVERLNGQGKVALLEGISSTVNTDRVKAAETVFNSASGIEIVGRGVGNWNREDAEKVMNDILVQNPEIDAIWAADDDMALGVENALRAAGRTGDVWVVGGGGMKDIVGRIKDGDTLFPATVTYPPSMIAVGIHEAASILRAGREKTLQFMPKHLVLDVELVTRENAEQYYFPDSTY